MHWIRRFIYFTGKRRPAALGKAQVTAFLNHLAAVRHVTARHRTRRYPRCFFSTRRCWARSWAGSTA
ncbi:MAG: phage integrase N-terminal SAM-like domain-containing protein [Pseudomonadota bacterium]